MSLRFSVDGWDPDYGASLQADGFAESRAIVDASVEVPATAWGGLSPSGPSAGTVWFVDGVRRLEAQLWIHADHEDDPPLPALAATIAAGVVKATAGSAVVEVAEVRRWVFSLVEQGADVASRVGTWKYRRCALDPGRPPEVVLGLGVQRALTELEIACAADARGGAAPADDLVVIDGSLRGRTAMPATVGLIKSHQVTYLDDLNKVVGRLAPGERTPVFHLGTTWERYSWYLRLPGGGPAPWAGIVRVEAPVDGGPDAAIAVANLTQSSLPRFASEPFKDPRAPQNLYPVSGLERELRRRLGDSHLVRRSLREAAVRA